MEGWELFGYKGRVLIELDLGGDRKITFPVDSTLEYLHPANSYGQLIIPVKGAWVTKTYGLLDDVEFRTGWTVE